MLFYNCSFYIHKDGFSPWMGSTIYWHEVYWMILYEGIVWRYETLRTVTLNRTQSLPNIKQESLLESCDITESLIRLVLHLMLINNTR
jgi:hypothetical protein